MPRRKKPDDRIWCRNCGCKITLAERIMRDDFLCTTCYIWLEEGKIK